MWAMYSSKSTSRFVSIWTRVVSFACLFQAEDAIRDATVTGVQTCALPILDRRQRDPDDGGVEQIHERRQQHHGDAHERPAVGRRRTRWLRWRGFLDESGHDV